MTRKWEPALSSWLISWSDPRASEVSLSIDLPRYFRKWAISWLAPIPMMKPLSVSSQLLNDAEVRAKLEGYFYSEAYKS